MQAPRHSWDAALYDDKHAFVWKHGAALLDLLAPRTGERVLDLGSGTGHLSAAIAATGAAVVGLDRSSQMCDKARAAYPHLHFVAGDAADFRFDQPFDAVFSNATLHWVRPPENAVRCVARATKPGGRFVAEFGGKGNVVAVLRAMRAAADRLGLRFAEPAWFFPGVGEYAAMLESTGFEVRFATLFDRPTPLAGPGGLRDWVMMFCPGVVAEERRDEFLTAVEDAARLELLRQGEWVVDYRRLRVVAVREEG